MASKEKGKATAGKRKRQSKRKRKRKRNGDDKSGGGSRKRRNPGVLQFLEHSAAEADVSDDSDMDDFMVEELEAENSEIAVGTLACVKSENYKGDLGQGSRKGTTGFGFFQGSRKGTTNFGFVFEHGVLLGADGRISTSFPSVGGVYSGQINVDCYWKVREIKGNFDGHIYCTMMGDAVQWYKLYRKLNNPQDPEDRVSSVADAVLKAFVHLLSYARTHKKDIKKHRKMLRFPLFIGMLIGGYTRTEGQHKLGIVYLEHKRAYWRLMDDAETGGSGARFANAILGTLTREQRRTYGEDRAMTAQEAFALGFTLLSFTSMKDVYSGGLFKEVHIEETNVDTRQQLSLEVYLNEYGRDYDGSGNVDEKSLFILYEWSYPVWNDDEIITMLSTVWPNDEVSWNGIEAWHVVAGRSGIYIHRILFYNPRRAEEAYNQVVRSHNRGPNDILEGRFFDRHLVVRSGTRAEPVYVGRSTPELLEEFIRMPLPANLAYPIPR